MSKKILLASLPLCVLFACGPASEIRPSISETKSVVTDGTGSFKMANKETLQMLVDADIEYWVGDDGAINYNLVDGEAIDRIGNDVILT